MEYRFSISQNTANGEVVGHILQEAIQRSEQVLIEPNHINTYGDELTIVMSADVTGGKAWRGAWDADETYPVEDMVVRGGVAYLCCAETTGHEPPNANYWEPQPGTSQIGALCALVAADLAAIPTITEAAAESLSTITTKAEQRMINLSPEEAFAAGDYYLEWSMRARYRRSNNSIVIRIDLDGVPLLELSEAGTKDWIYQSAKRRVELTEGQHTFELFVASGGSKDIDVSDVVLSVGRID